MGSTRQSSVEHFLLSSFTMYMECGSSVSNGLLTSFTYLFQLGPIVGESISKYGNGIPFAVLSYRESGNFHTEKHILALNRYANASFLAVDLKESAGAVSVALKSFGLTPNL